MVLERLLDVWCHEQPLHINMWSVRCYGGWTWWPGSRMFTARVLVQLCLCVARKHGASLNQSKDQSSVKQLCFQINVSYRRSGHSASNTCQWKSYLPPIIDCWVNITHSNRALSSMDDAIHGISDRYHSLINDRDINCFFRNLVANLVQDYHVTLWSLECSMYVALSCYSMDHTVP